MSTDPRSLLESRGPYKSGFVTDIESETVPPGLSEDIVRLISAKKNEPEWLLEWRLQGVPPLADDEGADLAERPLPADRLPGDRLLLGARSAKDGPKSLDEVDPEAARDLREARHPAARARRSCAGVAVDAVFDSVSVATTFKEKLAEVGIIFCSFSEAVQKHPELVQQVPRLGRPVHRQLLRGAELGRLHRRLVLLHPEGRALPDGAVDLLPHQRRQHRASSSGR